LTGFISYPRTAAELRSALSLGYNEVLRLLRARKMRVNLKGFLSHLFKEKQHDDASIDQLNKKLVEWREARDRAGQASAALVYHHSGVRILHGFTVTLVKYERKADRAVYIKERGKEFIQARKTWLKTIASTHAFELQQAGLPSAEIDRMARFGKVPSDANGKQYQVHHRIPLDDGGTNDPANFILMRDDVEHRAVHGYYNPAELRIDRLAYGASAEVALPMPPSDTIIYPNPTLGYVAEIAPHADFLDIYHED
jgi:hypothetical protein